MSNRKRIIDKITADYWNRRGETYKVSWMSLAKKRLSKLETDLIQEEIRLKRKENPGVALRTFDIGIGIGRISKVIMKYNVEHCGIDVSKTMIDYCRKKFKDNKKVKRLIVHDILNMAPRGWGGFDFVTAIRVLSYSDQWRNELSNIYKVMSPRGVLIFTFPNRYSSMFISKLIHHKNIQTPCCDVSKSELEKAIKEIGFSEYRVSGFFRLLDVFYDWSDGKISTKILFFIEKMFNLLLGKTFLTRLFYVVCKK